MRVVVAAGLIVLGLLGCAYGMIAWASIPRSDTATVALVGFGLTFAVPGLVAIATGLWLLRRRPSGGPSRRPRRDGAGRPLGRR